MKTKEEIQQMLDEEVNVLLAHHGGRADITDLSVVEPITASVTMSGGCRGCAGAKYTLRMIISNKILEFEPAIMVVHDVTDHATGTKPYYKTEEEFNGENSDN